MVMAEQPNNCDTTDSAALERLSQLLTTTTDGASEVSADLIALHVKNSSDSFHEFFSVCQLKKKYLWKQVEVGESI